MGIVPNFFQKLVNSFATLKITKTIFKWSHKRHYYPKEVNSNILELKDVFSKSTKPYSANEMLDFLSGKSNSVTINNGYCNYSINV